MLGVKGTGSGGKNKFPTGITVETAPNKTTYTAGETLDITGIKVKATFSDNTTKDITSQCTFAPANGTVIYEQNTNIDIAWEWESTITYHTTQAITVNRVLQSITITAPPAKTTFYKGDTLDLTGMVVTATFTSGMTEDVTASITSAPTDGTALTAYGNTDINVSYAERGITKTAKVTVSVSVKVVTWATGTDQEIVDMVEAADAGIISLSDYWAVGQERKILLSAMAATGVGESHVAQQVSLVLSNAGGKTLTGGKECNFQVDQKNCLTEYGYMNSTDTNSGGWKNSKRRTWCNSVYKNAIPSTLRGIFKPFVNKSGTGSSSSSGTEETTDDFALRAEVEIFGSATYSVSGEGSQAEYYKISANRVKKLGDSGSAYYWWERSPRSGYSTRFCYVNSDGSVYDDRASISRGLAPFGCI